MKTSVANIFPVFLFFSLFAQCQIHTNMKENEYKYTNHLINETSPYLLQHAHNPVDWYAWNDETLEKAKRENKMLLISIGYASCHWCHVMEHESFEDEEVAKLMNDNFICIKVDREERPDVDKIYMDAVQIIQGNGGWPLNCFALPDGRPVYGGTYFRKEQWISVLKQISAFYRERYDDLVAQAEQITAGIKNNDLSVSPDEGEKPGKKDIEKMIDGFKSGFDSINGGSKGAPKFPMPNNYIFLLHYAAITGDKSVVEDVELTLDRMSEGGIYDQIGGGFARYSVDAKWHIPHFEKMLYDNAQLVSLYSQAYRFTHKNEYRQVVEETLDFIKREMTSPEGAFYSSLDADSDGEEGKYYIWTEDEIKSITGENYHLIADYFGIGKDAVWEDEKNVPVKAMSIEELAKRYDLTEDEVAKIIAGTKRNLLEKREERIRPALDDKTLASWNALMIKGYADAYLAFGKDEYRKAALKNALFIKEKMKMADGGLYHNHKNGKATIPGFLEDYAFVSEAFTAMYKISYDEKWLYEAKQLADYAIDHFYDKETGMFFFTSDDSNGLIARKQEISDNVIPSSNSALANSLFVLGEIFSNRSYLDIAEKMTFKTVERMSSYPSYFSNYGILLLKQVYPFYSIVIYGDNADELAEEFEQYYLPNTFMLASKTKSDLPLFKDRYFENKTLIYVCTDKGCKLPVDNVKGALEQMEVSK